MYKIKQITSYLFLRYTSYILLSVISLSLHCSLFDSQSNVQVFDDDCPAIEKLNTSINFVCVYEDQEAPISFIFPSSSRLKNWLTQVTISTNEYDATTHYAENEEATISSNIYTNPIAVNKNASISYFSVDMNNNQEQPKEASYNYDNNALEVNNLSLSQTFLSQNSMSELIFSSNEDVTYILERGGSGTQGSGILIETSTLVADTNQTISISSSILEAGSNLFYLYLNSTSKSAYISFFIYSDIVAPIVLNNTPLQHFKDDLNLMLTVTKPSTVYYTINTSSTPSDPTTTSSNSLPIALTTAANSTTHYYIKYMAVDKAGNQSQVYSKEYIIDKEKPMFTLHSINGAFLKNNIYYLTKQNYSSRNKIIFEWESNELVDYSFEINSSNFQQGTILKSGDLAANSISNNPIDGTDFHEGSQLLQIYLKDPAGNITQNSYSIFLDNQANTPRSILPLLDHYQFTSNITFQWEDLNNLEENIQTGSGIANYELQYSIHRDFSSATTQLTAFDLFGSNESFTASSLASGIYFWRVRLIDNVENMSDWSPIRSFYINNSYKNVLDTSGNEGLPDLLVSAPLKNNIGSVYLYFNKSNISNDYVEIVGDELNSEFGHTIDIISDVNRGGFADILISAPKEDNGSHVDAGAVYVFYGETISNQCANVYPCTINTSSANLIIRGENSFDNFGTTLSSAGDFNQDGFGDFIIGNLKTNVGSFIQAGSASLYYGSSSTDANADLVFTGFKSAENFSSCLAYLGDINGDSFADLLMGASGGNQPLSTNNEGVAYVYYGSSSPNTNVNLTLIGSNLSASRFGASCNRGFDINQDGFEDFIIGAPNDPSFGLNYGALFIYHGAFTPLPTPILRDQHGLAQGLYGSNIVAVNTNSTSNSEILSLGAGSSLETAYIINAPLTTSSVNASLSNANTIGNWGKLDSTNQDYYAVGNLLNGEVKIYKQNFALDTTISGNSSDHFGFAISD